MNTKIIILIFSTILFIINAFLVVSKNIYIVDLNNTVKTFIESSQYPFLFNFFSIMTKVGGVIGSSIIIIGAGLFLASKNTKSFQVFLIAVALGALLPVIIKILTAIPRPSMFPTDFSFPSGHAAIATVFLLSFVFLLIPLITNGIIKNTVFVISLIIFPMIAFSRIYLSVHWTSDVVAGIFLGITCFLSSSLLLL